MSDKNFNKDNKGTLKKKAKIIGYGLLFTAMSMMPSINVKAQTNSNAQHQSEIPEYVSNNVVEFQKYKQFVKNLLASEDEEVRKKGEFLSSDINKGFKYYLEYKKEKGQEKQRGGNSEEFPEMKKHAIDSNGVLGTYSIGFVKDNDEYKFRYVNSLSTSGVQIDYKITGHNASEMQKHRCRNAYCSNEVYKDIMKRTNNGKNANSAEKMFMKYFEKELKTLNLIRKDDGSIKNKDVADNATILDEFRSKAGIHKR